MPKSLENMIYILILSMLTAFGPICTDIYLPALPKIGEFFAQSPYIMALTLTSSFLGLAIGQVFIGPLSDYKGRRLLLMLSLIIFIISSFLCTISSNVNEFIVYRFFQGLAGAGGIVLSRAIACDLYKDDQLIKFMSLLMIINALAPILGPILGSFILSFFSWQSLFYFLTIWGYKLLDKIYKNI